MPQEVFINIEPLFTELGSMGVRTIIAHIERITVLTAQPMILRRWIEKSVFLQITASSLLGKFGKDVARTSWELLFSGSAAIVASDSHDIKLRRPCMTEAFECIRLYAGEEIARKVCIENPSQIIAGKDIETAALYERLASK